MEVVGCGFEFDADNKILLVRFDGRLTDESVAEFYRAIRKYWTAADASVGIVDFSSVTEFALSSNLIHQSANQEPMHVGCDQPLSLYRCSGDVCIWASSHVSDYGRTDKAAPACRTHAGRGVGNTPHSVPPLRTVRVTVGSVDNNRPLHSELFGYEFYQKGCQEESSASTGGEMFSRDPAHWN